MPPRHRRTTRVAAAAVLATALAVWIASYARFAWRSPAGGSVIALTRGCLIWHRAVPPGVLNPPKNPTLQFGGGLYIGGDPHCRATWLPWLTRHRNRQGRVTRTEASLPMWTLAAACAVCLAWTRRRPAAPSGGAVPKTCPVQGGQCP